ncbi:MAG: EAL domain-containing protein [Lachnospiraceae bacterium]|nr:EAL domain-containing protein [Lachnospiraceae bacterium]
MVKKQTQRSLIEMMNDVLSMVRDYYDSEYAYYIEKDSDGIRSIYEWCNEGVPWVRDKIKMLNAEEYPPWLAAAITDTNAESYSVFQELEDGATAVLAAVNVHRGGCTMDLLRALLLQTSETIVLIKKQKQQEFLSYHDRMTGLLNRNSYLDYLEELQYTKLKSLGALFVNVNGLKSFNEEFGRDYGDEVVIRVGEVLEEFFKGDMIFRFNGDEYLVLSQNTSYETFMEGIHKAHNFLEHISLGLATMGYSWEKTDINPEDLVTQADEMMRNEKQKYYKRIQKGRHVPIIKEDLLEDIKVGNFIVCLIPKFDLYSDRIAGAEAVVRYHHKDLGVMNPERYMTLLEDTNLSSYLDLYIFEEVCKTIAKWSREDLPMVPIAINFSGSTLRQENITEKMLELIEKYHITSEYLEIEISETNDDINQEMLAEIGNKMRKTNIRVILDHFGAKHSSFSVLSLMDFDSLKLDASLVANIVVSRRSQIVARAVIDICRQLDTIVVADGVETIDQLNVLKELGCSYAQGVYFNKPIAIDTFEVRYMRD